MLGLRKKSDSEKQDALAITPLQLVTQNAATQKSAKPRTIKKSKDSVGTDQTPELKRQVELNRSIHGRINARAYEIYEERSRIGGPVQDWLRAEREVLALMEYEGHDG